MTALFDRNGLSIERLRSFIAVAEAGSITLAALGKPSRQSLISRQMDDLEKFYGFKLTERRGRNIIFTPAGEALVVAARVALAQLADVAAVTAEAPLDVSIGAGDSVIQWWLFP